MPKHNKKSYRTKPKLTRQKLESMSDNELVRLSKQRTQPKRAPKRAPTQLKPKPDVNVTTSSSNINCNTFHGLSFPPRFNQHWDDWSVPGTNQWAITDECNRWGPASNSEYAFDGNTTIIPCCYEAGGSGSLEDPIRLYYYMCRNIYDWMFVKPSAENLNWVNLPIMYTDEDRPDPILTNIYSIGMGTTFVGLNELWYAYQWGDSNTDWYDDNYVDIYLIHQDNLCPGEEDCAGIYGGTTEIDQCGICGGDGNCCPNGIVDACGNCNGDCSMDVGSGRVQCGNNPNNTIVADCLGTCGGFTEFDNCNVCGGDCTGTCGNDACGNCGGNILLCNNGMYWQDIIGEFPGGCDIGAWCGCPDENGVWPVEDECGTCLDGTEGDDYECSPDCSESEDGCDGTWLNGQCWGGTAVIDDCNVCGGDAVRCNDGLYDYEVYYDDETDVCSDGIGIYCDCDYHILDCAGNCACDDIWTIETHNSVCNDPGAAVMDECGVCNGGIFTSADCEPYESCCDCCGVPNGDGTTCGGLCGPCNDNSSCLCDCGEWVCYGDVNNCRTCCTPENQEDIGCNTTYEVIIPSGLTSGVGLHQQCYRECTTGDPTVECVTYEERCDTTAPQCEMNCDGPTEEAALANCPTGSFCHSGWNGNGYGPRTCRAYHPDYCSNPDIYGDYPCGPGDGDCEYNNECGDGSVCDHDIGTPEDPYGTCFFSGKNGITAEADCCVESDEGDAGDLNQYIEEIQNYVDVGFLNCTISSAKGGSVNRGDGSRSSLFTVKDCCGACWEINMDFVNYFINAQMGGGMGVCYNPECPEDFFSEGPNFFCSEWRWNFCNCTEDCLENEECLSYCCGPDEYDFNVEWCPVPDDEPDDEPLLNSCGEPPQACNFYYEGAACQCDDPPMGCEYRGDCCEDYHTLCVDGGIPEEGGCTDTSACNHDINATFDDGSCEYYDCSGECGGSNQLDACGICGGGNTDSNNCGCSAVCMGTYPQAGEGYCMDFFGCSEGAGCICDPNAISPEKACTMNEEGTNYCYPECYYDNKFYIRAGYSYDPNDWPNSWDCYEPWGDGDYMCRTTYSSCSGVPEQYCGGGFYDLEYYYDGYFWDSECIWHNPCNCADYSNNSAECDNIDGCKWTISQNDISCENLNQTQCENWVNQGHCSGGWVEQEFDCAGVCGGNSIIDSCGICGGDGSSCGDIDECGGCPNICTGGNLKLNGYCENGECLYPSTQGCSSGCVCEDGGTNCCCNDDMDECGVCYGDGICDCVGEYDNCGVCISFYGNYEPCTQDCNGTWGGSFELDCNSECIEPFPQYFYGPNKYYFFISNPHEAHWFVGYWFDDDTGTHHGIPFETDCTNPADPQSDCVDSWNAPAPYGGWYHIDRNPNVTHYFLGERYWPIETKKTYELNVTIKHDGDQENLHWYYGNQILRVFVDTPDDNGNGHLYYQVNTKVEHLKTDSTGTIKKLNAIWTVPSNYDNQEEISIRWPDFHAPPHGNYTWIKISRRDMYKPPVGDPPIIFCPDENGDDSHSSEICNTGPHIIPNEMSEWFWTNDCSHGCCETDDDCTNGQFNNCKDGCCTTGGGGLKPGKIFKDERPPVRQKGGRTKPKPKRKELEKLSDEELLNLASDKVLVDIKSTEKRTKPKIAPRPIRPKPSIVSPSPEVQTMTVYDDPCTIEIGGKCLPDFSYAGYKYDRESLPQPQPTVGCNCTVTSTGHFGANQLKECLNNQQPYHKICLPQGEILWKQELGNILINKDGVRLVGYGSDLTWSTDGDRPYVTSGTAIRLMGEFEWDGNTHQTNPMGIKNSPKILINNSDDSHGDIQFYDLTHSGLDYNSHVITVDDAVFELNRGDDVWIGWDTTNASSWAIDMQMGNWDGTSDTYGWNEVTGNSNKSSPTQQFFRRVVSKIDHNAHPGTSFVDVYVDTPFRIDVPLNWNPWISRANIGKYREEVGIQGIALSDAAPAHRLAWQVEEGSADGMGSGIDYYSNQHSVIEMKTCKNCWIQDVQSYPHVYAHDGNTSSWYTNEFTDDVKNGTISVALCNIAQQLGLTCTDEVYHQVMDTLLENAFQVPNPQNVPDGSNAWGGLGDDTYEPRHLISGGIRISACKNVTIEDTKMSLPQNRGGGSNGYNFIVNSSSDILFRNCEGYRGRHNFVVGKHEDGIVFDAVKSSGGCVMLEPADDYWSRYTGLEVMPLGKPGLSDTHNRLNMAVLVQNSQLEDGWYAENRHSMSGNAGKTATNTVFWNNFANGVPEGTTDENQWIYSSVPGLGMIQSHQHDVGWLIDNDLTTYTNNSTAPFDFYYDLANKYSGLLPSGGPAQDILDSIEDFSWNTPLLFVKTMLKYRLLDSEYINSMLSGFQFEESSWQGGMCQAHLYFKFYNFHDFQIDDVDVSYDNSTGQEKLIVTIDGSIGLSMDETNGSDNPLCFEYTGLTGDLHLNPQIEINFTTQQITLISIGNFYINWDGTNWLFDAFVDFFIGVIANFFNEDSMAAGFFEDIIKEDEEYYFTKINEIRNSYDWFYSYLHRQTEFTDPEDIVDDSGETTSEIPDLLQYQKDLGYSNEWVWIPYTPPVVPGGGSSPGSGPQPIKGKKKIKPKPPQQNIE